MTKSRTRQLKERIRYGQRMMYAIRFELNEPSSNIMIKEFIRYCKSAREELRNSDN